MNQPIIADTASANYKYVTAMGSAADNIVFAEFLAAEDPLPPKRIRRSLSQRIQSNAKSCRGVHVGQRSNIDAVL